jgi:hypothetical protein
MRSEAASRLVFYRVWQFLRASLARVHPHEYILVEQLLSPAQATLFRQMARCDQRHSLDVLYTLQKAGDPKADLVVAALLHDVGKVGGRLTVWHRVAVVLLQRFAPGWLAHLAANGKGWRVPFAVHVQHPQVGAQRAADAGCSPETVDLIRRHHDTQPKDKLLVALQWADRQN